MFIEKASPAGQGITGNLTIHNMSHQLWLIYNYLKRGKKKKIKTTLKLKQTF